MSKAKPKDKPKDTPKAKRRVVDLEALERDYRAGVLSLSELGRLHGGVSKQSIDKAAKRFGWTRDLSGKVAQLARAQLSHNAIGDVAGDVLGDDVVDGQPSRARADERTVEENAAVLVQVVRGHRVALARSNRLIAELHNELENHLKRVREDTPEKAQAEGRKAPFQLDLDKAGKLVAALAAAQSKVIPLERQAFNVDGARPAESQDTDLPESVRENLAIYQR